MEEGLQCTGTPETGIGKTAKWSAQSNGVCDTAISTCLLVEEGKRT